MIECTINWTKLYECKVQAILKGQYHHDQQGKVIITVAAA